MPLFWYSLFSTDSSFPFNIKLYFRRESNFALQIFETTLPRLKVSSHSSKQYTLDYLANNSIIIRNDELDEENEKVVRERKADRAHKMYPF